MIQLKNLECEKCRGEMRKKHEAAHSQGASLLLIILGILLFFLFPIGTIFGVIFFFVGLRRGIALRYFWVCRDCGYKFEFERTDSRLDEIIGLLGLEKLKFEMNKRGIIMLSSITLLVTLLIVVLLNVVSSKPVSEKLQTPTPSASAISAEEIAAKAKAQAEEQAAFDKTPAGKMCKQHPGWSRDDCQRVVNKTYWIGMSYDMLVTEIGKPDSANPSNYGSGVHWQWCWYDIKPSCFYDSDGDKLIDSYN